MSIGTRIRAARKSAGLSQKALAARVGIKQPTLSELETSESAGTTYVASLAAALGVSALWLETGKGEMRTEPPEETLSQEALEVARAFDKLPEAEKPTILRALGLHDAIIKRHAVG